MSVVAFGDEPVCGLCTAVSVAQSAVVTTQIEARDEEEVIGLLSAVNSFLCRPRRMA